MRDRLIELIKQGDEAFADKYTGKVMSHIDEVYEFVADYLLKHGVIVTPCVAMVEQVLKDGEIDRPKTLHYAGKYSVVYIDKSKWKIPLIDITEQCYNDEKALKRIQALKGGEG